MLRRLSIYAVVLCIAAALHSMQALAAERAESLKLTLPPDCYAVVGTPMSIYYDNIVLTKKPEQYRFKIEGDLGNAETRRWTVTPTACDIGDHKLAVSVSTSDGKLLQRAETVLHIAAADAGTGKTIRLLIVGDSLTAATHYPNEIARLLSQPGNPAWTMLGTHRPTHASKGVGHEGYGGWTWGRFANYYLEKPNPAKHEYSSPFVFAVKGNKPAFDLDRYFATHCDSQRPDFVTFLLGINDCFGANPKDPAAMDASIDAVFKNADNVIAAFRKSAPKAALGICLTTPPNTREAAFQANYQGKYPRWGWKTIQHRLVQRQIEHFGGRQAEHIFIVPTELNLDPVDGYPENNGVHPNESGYRQIGASIFAWLKWQMQHTRKEQRHTLAAVPLQQVALDDPFWSPRYKIWREVTIPDVLDKFEKGGAVDNFDHVAKGDDAKTHRGPSFSDGLLYEVLRGCADYLVLRRDPALESRIDGIVDRIAAAQSRNSDGYLNTWTQLKAPAHRWGVNCGDNVLMHDIHLHDMYNAGCLVEAGVHYYRATGKTKLLEVAVRMANHIADVMGKPPKLTLTPGHSIGEEALAKLYLLFREQPKLKERLSVPVREAEYLSVAESWIENRGTDHVNRKAFPQFGLEYTQDHKPVFQQETIEGHAVRAVLMCAGLAAIAPVNGRDEYYASAERLWNNMVSRRMYITGGVGAIAGTESFAGDYQLPNAGYLETCAGCAATFFAHNMNLAFGHARYVDELERALYNNVLSGVSQSGNYYSYVNPLEYKVGHSRWAWHDCPCCPPMFLKTTGAMPSYIYAQDADGLYVNLFVGSRANVTVKDRKLTIRQTTKYPWEGGVRLELEPSESVAFNLYLRIPAWVQGEAASGDLYQASGRPASGDFLVIINGKPVANLSSERGYAKLSRTWQAGDCVEIDMAMRVERMKAHPAVKDCKQRGPVVYAVETLGNRPPVENLSLLPDAALSAEYRSDLLGGTTVVQGDFQEQSATESNMQPVKIAAIPYFDYGNRGPSALRVWIPEGPRAATAASATGKITTLTNPLAIRIHNYGKYQDAAWMHLPSIGMHYMFMGVPTAEELPAVQKRMAEHGLKPLVLRGDSDLGRDNCLDELAAQLAVCEKMGVKYMFLSPKHTGVGKEVAYERLRRLGDIAKKHGVIVVLETHPDLGANAAMHLETMKAVNHPNVRVNFDTGNITFYNKGTDAVAELKKIIDYVATVELKDHNGKYMTWNFPALGKGVVDFPAILKILENRRFQGPITMEVEGIQGVTMDENQTKQYIAKSIAYIQSLGDFQ
jgi:DUF1680 family protein/sugar phosphate isomerase/epimerase/lysophospholipase L1-like esterase